MSAYAISNALDVSPVRDYREKQYMDIISKYKDDETIRVAEMLRTVTEAYEENPEQDFLGTVFMELDMGNPYAGQFFTPYNISRLLAQIATPDPATEISKNGYVQVNEPCVGGGAMLIACANELRRHGFDCSWQMWYEGQDVSYVAALMAYIQTSLLGMAGVIIVADTLLHPSGMGLSDDKQALNTFYTPMAYRQEWVDRAAVRRLSMISQKEELRNEP